VLLRNWLLALPFLLLLLRCFILPYTFLLPLLLFLVD
jgi:hypothetical protein